MNFNRVAAALVALLFCYYEVFRWIPLARWNWQFSWPVVNDQFYPDIIIGGLLLLFVLVFLKNWRWPMWLAVVMLGLWVIVHFFDWWLPYAKDSTGNFSRYSFYASHTQILPVVGHHYPPDGAHAILDLILYPTWMVCIAAASRHARRA